MMKKTKCLKLHCIIILVMIMLRFSIEETCFETMFPKLIGGSNGPTYINSIDYDSGDVGFNIITNILIFVL